MLHLLSLEQWLFVCLFFWSQTPSLKNVCICNCGCTFHRFWVLTGQPWMIRIPARNHLLLRSGISPLSFCISMQHCSCIQMVAELMNECVRLWSSDHREEFDWLKEWCNVLLKDKWFKGIRSIVVLYTYVCVCVCVCLLLNLGLPRWPLVVKKIPANAADKWDAGLIPGLGRSPSGGNGNSLQSSWLENPMGLGVWQAAIHRVANSQTWLKT